MGRKQPEISDAKLVDRIPWYYNIVKEVRTRSTCNKLKVGALLINPKNYRVVSMGYNGSPPGASHCSDQRNSSCITFKNHCINTLHAEINALANLEKTYDELIMVSTNEPCMNCYKIMIAFKVKTCIFFEPYKDEGRDLLINSYGDIMKLYWVDM